MFLFNCDHSYFKTFNHRSLTLSNSSQRAFFLLFSFSVYDLIILTTNDETPNIATAAPTSWALSDTDCFEPRKWWVLIIDLVNEAISKILVHHDTRICLYCTIGQKAITPINAFKFASRVFLLHLVNFEFLFKMMRCSQNHLQMKYVHQTRHIKHYWWQQKVPSFGSSPSHFWQNCQTCFIISARSYESEGRPTWFFIYSAV